MEKRIYGVRQESFQHHFIDIVVKWKVIWCGFESATHEAGSESGLLYNRNKDKRSKTVSSARNSQCAEYSTKSSHLFTKAVDLRRRAASPNRPTVLKIIASSAAICIQTSSLIDCSPWTLRISNQINPETRQSVSREALPPFASFKMLSRLQKSLENGARITI